MIFKILLSIIVFLFVISLVVVIGFAIYAIIYDKDPSEDEYDRYVKYNGNTFDWEE